MSAQEAIAKKEQEFMAINQEVDELKEKLFLKQSEAYTMSLDLNRHQLSFLKNVIGDLQNQVKTANEKSALTLTSEPVEVKKDGSA